jgi:hypothetical protein
VTRRFEACGWTENKRSKGFLRLGGHRFSETWWSWTEAQEVVCLGGKGSIGGPHTRHTALFQRWRVWRKEEQLGFA